MEIVGRFPSDEEATELNISCMSPVWLGTRNDVLPPSFLTSEMLTRLRRLREEVIIKSKTLALEHF